MFCKKMPSWKKPMRYDVNLVGLFLSTTDKNTALIEGVMRGSSLEGFYIYPTTTRSGDCPLRKFKNGNEATDWGTFQWTFSGDSFKGNWNICSNEIDTNKNEWTGTRIDY